MAAFILLRMLLVSLVLLVRWAGAAFIMIGIAGAAFGKWSRSELSSVIVLAADRVAHAMVVNVVSVVAMAVAGKAFALQYLEASGIWKAS